MKVATIEDHTIVCQLAIEFFQNSPYKNDRIDLDKLSDLVTHFLTLPKEDAIILLHEDRGILVGAAAEKLYNSERFASEVIFWITPSARGAKTALKLIAAYEYWAKEVAKVQTIQLVGLGPQTHKLYSRMGYTLSELTYIKDVI